MTSQVSAFFPDPVFGWTFYLVLVAITAVASYFDLRYMKIPKATSLIGLALGLLFNIVRGGWMGANGYELWHLETGSTLLGGLDGLLFALEGFALGFGLLFVLWVLGTCGGGDVKLFAALGAWVGPEWVLYVLLGTMVLWLVYVAGRLVWSVCADGFQTTMKNYSAKGARRAEKRKARGFHKPRKRLAALAPCFTLSTAAVMFWIFRTDLLNF
jgi:Flp pilus assembly protein protease CpaA